jgi:iron complex transport system ATP-binding protein
MPRKSLRTRIPPAIELRNVSLHRGSTHILQGVNWTVPQGTCAAILGPNGSGKSTLARLLACHLWPTGGDAYILGHSFGDTNLLALRKSIRLVQATGPLEVDASLTTREVVETGFFSTIGLYDRVTPAMQRQARRLLRQVGLSHVAEHPYATLSSGERVRSLIARALAYKPRLLLLDEPTAGLDLLAREQVLATIQAMFHARAQPPTVVMITHHVEELPPATSEVLVLSGGHVAASGTPHQTLRSEVLSRAYGCPLKVRHAGGRWYVQVHSHAWKALIPKGDADQSIPVGTKG